MDDKSIHIRLRGSEFTPPSLISLNPVLKVLPPNNIIKFICDTLNVSETDAKDIVASFFVYNVNTGRLTVAANPPEIMGTTLGLTNRSALLVSADNWFFSPAGTSDIRPYMIEDGRIGTVWVRIQGPAASTQGTTGIKLEIDLLSGDITVLE